jgi:hypothetical protein
MTYKPLIRAYRQPSRQDATRTSSDWTALPLDGHCKNDARPEHQLRLRVISVFVETDSLFTGRNASVTVQTTPDRFGPGVPTLAGALQWRELGPLSDASSAHFGTNVVNGGPAVTYNFDLPEKRDRLIPPRNEKITK